MLGSIGNAMSSVWGYVKEPFYPIRSLLGMESGTNLIKAQCKSIAYSGIQNQAFHSAEFTTHLIRDTLKWTVIPYALYKVTPWIYNYSVGHYGPVKKLDKYMEQFSDKLPTLGLEYVLLNIPLQMGKDFMNKVILPISFTHQVLE